MGSVVLMDTLPGASRPQVIEEEWKGYWSPVKAQKAGLCALSALTMAGAAAAVCLVSAPLVFTAASLAFASVSFAGIAYRLIDYDDQVVLARLREEVWQAPLPEILAKHGWEKLFGYALLDAQNFERAYKDHVETISFPELLKFFHEAEAGLLHAPRLNNFSKMQEYAILPPSLWKEKFELETKEMRCDAILTSYPLEDLKTFSLITEAQQAALEGAGKAIQSKEKCDAALEQEFLDRTPHERMALDRAVELAELTYRSHAAHADLRQIDADECFAVSGLRACIRSRICDETHALEQYRSRLLTSGCCLPPEVQRELCCRERCARSAIDALRREESAGISRIRWDAMIRRQAVMQVLSLAEGVKNTSIAMAKEEFLFRTRPIREEIDARKAENHEQCEQKIKELNKQYRS